MSSHLNCLIEMVQMRGHSHLNRLIETVQMRGHNMFLTRINKNYPSYPTGHSERKKKKRQTEKEVGRQYQRVDRNGLCQLN